MSRNPPVTQPRAAELEHERLTSLINSMADGAIATNKAGNVVLYNGAALNILDINSSITGKPLSSILKLYDKNNQVIDIKTFVLQAKTPQTSRDLNLHYADGEKINLYISIAPVRLGYGKNGAGGHVLLLRDITREKSLEEERDEFISVVSHELRTPIAIAEGNISNAQFILDKTGNLDQVKEALSQTHTQVTFLAGMINDLSTLSRAERGKLTIDIEDINAHELVEELAANYTAEAENKGLEIKIENDSSLEVLRSSKLYVREILQNFITNAIKYTERGSVTLGARKKADGVLFEVSDTGIGISKADQDKVFDKFFRSEDYRTKASSGTGLGLYVTMKLARLIHADIDLKSELNAGTTFAIFIPNLQ